MKKLMILLFSACSLNVMAQNVGVGITAPDEILHVDSTIRIGKNTALPTVVGTRANQIKFGDYEYVRIGEMFKDDQLNIEMGTMVIKKSPGSLGSGFLGIGVDTPTASLDLGGTFKFRGGTPETGKVLMSDATGVTTWQPVNNGIRVPFSLYGNESDPGSVATITSGSGSALKIIGGGGGLIPSGSRGAFEVDNTLTRWSISAASLARGAAYLTSSNTNFPTLYAINNAATAGGIAGRFNGNVLIEKNTNGANGNLTAQGTLTASGLEISSKANLNNDTYIGGFLGVGTFNPNYKLQVQDGSIAIASTADVKTWYMNYSTVGDYFQLAEDGTARMIVANGGNVGIGTNSPAQKLSVSGNICATGTIAACSDIRFKTDLTPLTGALQTVMQLNPIYYYWNKDFKDKGFTGDRQLGFSAQEVEKFYPEMVQTGPDGYKAVDYSRMTPVLVDAIKEQQVLIEKQAAELKDLKVRLERLERMMKE